ncbi:GNAT family N-acetyltransferase [Parendozoicomonas haliclonae]|uniref:Mycothiol acetyltransferase n=1 Tax=Parendozoicomonas haliclonae TaxID=1960125 RepID=A0A1X7AIN5_9GAMM|nr:GNAT family N-acetyltransferase [Parendozoicomonas haliclonae]SMA44086.1 Mycothiol acetyltransferase [Parendozoicomonas haliclonae]
MTQLFLRPAIKEDNFVISEISVAGWRFAYRGIMADEVLDNLDVEKRAAGRTAFLKTAHLEAYVCEQGEQVVGFVDFAKSRDDDVEDTVGEVWAIYVLPEAIGRGVGQRLMALAEQKLATQGFTELTLWVLADNHQARRFYERAGFACDGGEKTYRDSGLTELRYRKSLC